MKKVLFSIIFCVLLNVPAVMARTIELGLAAMEKSGRLPNIKEVKHMGRRLGAAIDTVNWYMGINGERNELPNFPLSQVRQYKNSGIVLMLTLEPWGADVDQYQQPKNPLEKYQDGSLDWYFRRLARDMRRYGDPIRLRFGHEMIDDDNYNGHYPITHWYPWQDHPQEYKEAYMRVYQIFKDEKADNVEFVWSVNNWPNKKEILAKYYPGAAYVDWIGLDGYNNGGESFDALFKKIYATLTENPDIFGQKPIMLSEFAAGARRGSAEPFYQDEWITDAFTKIIDNYPQIAAVYWFNVNKERNWCFDTSEKSFCAFKDMACRLKELN